MWKLKDDVDLSVLEKYGYIEEKSHYTKMCGKRDVLVWKDDRQIVDYKCDSSTYTGYAYGYEYRHATKRYIQDLIKDDLVIEIKGI